MKETEVKNEIDSKSLSKFAKNVFSQSGEDGIIEKITEIIGEKKGWCVEFGAWDGKHLSNTYNLMKNGWSGVFIEGSKKRCQDLVNTYRDNAKAHCICAFVDFEGENRLDSILGKTPIPKDFGILSIDIDGNDYHIWDSLQDYKPKVVIIEFNPSIPNDIIFIQKKDMSVQHGSSLRAFVELGRRKGYELVATTRLNGIFIKKELFSLFNLASNEINALYDGKKYQTRIFQLYDGTLVVDGCEKLLWHDIPLRHSIQVLPKFLRVFHSSDHWFHYAIFRIYRRLIKLISRSNIPYKEY